jgi:hypothetical protein
MKKKLCIVAVLFLAISVAACILAITRKESSKCSINSLIVDEERMPEGWSNKWGVLPPALELLGAQQAYCMIIQNGNETASHTVYQYSNAWLAAFHVWFDRETFFPSVGWDWSDLERANDLSLHADQRQIKCGTGNYPLLGDQCTAILRYGTYVSDFGSSIDEEGAMSTEEFIEIVLKIDELFSSCE